MNEYFRLLIDALNYDLFSIGQTHISPLRIIEFLVLGLVLIYMSGKLKNLLASKILARTSLVIGTRQAIATVVRYLVLFIGFIIILQILGVDLTAFNVLAGAVGIGIGFGLQNIANNFISGLIILFERPIQVGDRIEVANVLGDVTSIGPRSTYIKTNDNITIIVPNSKFISENVTNLSYAGNLIRFKIPAWVTHDADIDLASKLMIEAANENPDVSKENAPCVRFIKFDLNGILLELRAWSTERLTKPGLFKSDLNFAIIRKFRQNGVKLADSGRISVTSQITNEDENNLAVRNRRHGSNRPNTETPS